MKERCVRCGQETEYDVNTPVTVRLYFIEGAGQLCRECWKALYEDSRGKEHMSDLRKKKEFLYFLDGKYYIIGRNECKECDDEELISLYQEFLSLTNDELFKDFDPREVWKVHRDKVADVFKKILDTCDVPIEKSEMTDDKKLLRERLENKYEVEINEQVVRWLKADTCLTHKMIDEKQG